MYLIGLGQDSHRLKKSHKGQTLALAGLSFDCGLTFVANSDGDVILHSLCNALSTALGGGSFSQLADPLCAQGIVNSKIYLEKFLKKMTESSYQIQNLSLSLEGSKPKLEKYNQALKNSLANLCQIDPSRVGLAFTSGEGLNAYGLGEGIACTTIVLLKHL